jgi:macrolide transport system ATP-binding/permease protein
VIELKKISRTYDTGKVQVPALRNITISIAQGEFVAIMGHSGSGKSTLLNILGFLDKPDSGSYRFLGREITEFKDDHLSNLRNYIAGFVFQQFHLLPRMTALENTELPLIYAGKKYLKDIARRMVSEVGLSHREEHYSNELSGGEQQRVAIARSMVNEPLMILADEPTGNLDTASGMEILSILRNLNENGKTVIMVTHEKEIARHAKRIIRMRDGEIISDKVYERRGAKKTTPTYVPDDIFSKSGPSFGRAELGDFIRQAVSSIFSHKLRSILSMLGILIGVTAVISMLAIGQGAKEAISEQLSSLGSNLLIIRPGSFRSRGVALEAGSVTRLSLQDSKAISKLDEIAGVSPSVRGIGQLVFGNRNWRSWIEGVGVEYENVKTSTPQSGRFFTEREVRMREKVAVVGMTVVRELFDGMDPVGRIMKINRINFKVIGVLPERGAWAWRDRDDIVVIPITTAMYRLLGKEYIDSIDAEVKSPELIDQAKETIRDLIIKRNRLTEDNEDSFHIMDMTEFKDAVQSTTRTMSWLLGSVAAISLLVGGIGIMNIMLVTVKERTREIGLRKAIGARRKDILIQFLIESIFLTFWGGVTGILLGSGISLLLSSLAGWPIKISFYSVLLATLFSIMVGLCFGLWPAIQASRLKPVEALRYE